ncbi:hypothetical protein D9M72_299500 [compost metagenome]
MSSDEATASPLHKEMRLVSEGLVGAVGMVSPSVETLDRLAQGLHVPVPRFLGDQTCRSDFCHVRARQGGVVDRVGAVSDYPYDLEQRQEDEWQS